MALRIGSKKLLAIDWDARDLRVVLFRPRGDSIDLLKGVSIPIAPNVNMSDAESMGAFLREALRQARISVHRALMNIPRDRVVLNTLKFPPTPADDLPAMVQFQIVKELPFAADQATIDFATNGQFDPKTPSSVLVAAVRSEELGFYRDVAKEAGLTPDIMGLRPHANLVAVTVKAPEVSQGMLLLVEVGPQLTEINIIREGVLAFSRAASVSLREIKPQPADRYEDSRISTSPVADHRPDEATEQVIRSLLIEVNRSFDAYRATDPSAQVDHILVAGASGVESELAQGLSARFGVRAGLYSPDRALELTPQRAKELRGFSAVLGLALSHERRGLATFNFLQPKKPINKRKVQMRKAPVGIAAALLFATAGAVSYQRHVAPRVKEAETKKKLVEEKKKRQKVVEEFGKKVQAIEDWLTAEQYLTQRLEQVTKTFPPEEEAYAPRIMFEMQQDTKKGGQHVMGMTVSLKMKSSDIVNRISARLAEAGFIDPTPDVTVPPTSSGWWESKVRALLPPQEEAKKTKLAAGAGEHKAESTPEQKKTPVARPPAARPPTPASPESAPAAEPPAEATANAPEAAPHEPGTPAVPPPAASESHPTGTTLTHASEPHPVGAAAPNHSPAHAPPTAIPEPHTGRALPPVPHGPASQPSTVQGMATSRPVDSSPAARRRARAITPPTSRPAGPAARTPPARGPRVKPPTTIVPPPSGAHQGQPGAPASVTPGATHTPPPATTPGSATVPPSAPPTPPGTTTQPANTSTTPGATTPPTTPAPPPAATTPTPTTPPPSAPPPTTTTPGAASAATPATVTTPQPSTTQPANAPASGKEGAQ